MNEALQILYRDPAYVAVFKPHGLLVHRSRLDARERDACLQRLRDQVGRPVFPCHRLDRPTAGVLLFAFTREAHQAASALFAGRGIRKTYLALVRGWMLEPVHLEAPLRPLEEDGGGTALPAETEIHPLQTFEFPFPVRPYATARYSLVELRPLTGRRHQLRRHLAHLRHPIVGDTRHGDGAHNRAFREHLGHPFLMLEARQLEMIHPLTGRPLRLYGPKSSLFLERVRTLGQGPMTALTGTA